MSRFYYITDKEHHSINRDVAIQRVIEQDDNDISPQLAASILDNSQPGTIIRGAHGYGFIVVGGVYFNDSSR